MRVILARRTVRRVPAALAFLLPLVLAAPAAAEPTRLGTTFRPPLVDAAAGRVVWQPDSRSIRVLELGAGAPARRLGLPPGCEPGSAGALRGDRLVLVCGDGPRLLDVDTGASGPVPGAAAAGIGAPGSGVATVGSVWAEGWADDASVFFALDGSAVDRGPGAADELPDLDARRLWRRMCAPLARTPDPERYRPFLPYQYSPPLGLDLRRFPYRALRVDRCGRERPLTLSRCRRACAAVTLGAGSIAWRERGRIRLYRGRSRRRASWPARAFGPLATPYPTRRHVVVAAGAFGAGYSVWSVRAAT